MEPSSLDVALSEDLALVLDAVRELAQSTVLPDQEARAGADVHPEDLWAELAGLGLFGTSVPEDQGGAGLGILAHVLTVETLARAGGLAGVLPVCQGLVIQSLLASVESGLDGKLLEGLAQGTILGAPALQEGDPGQVATLASGERDELRLTGEKVLVAFPGRAQCYVVRAASNGSELLALVDREAPGLRHEGPVAVLGLRGLESGRLCLKDVPARLLGGEQLLEAVFTRARIAVSALLCGLARGAIDHAVRYAGERHQFGGPLRDLGAIQERLARSDARCAALRGLVHGAARLWDADQPCAQAANRARQLAAEVAVGVSHECLQVFGGYGFSREYPAERIYRDARFPGFGEHHPEAAAARSMAALEA